MAELDGQRLDLSYGGVRAVHRGQHIFRNLVKTVMAKGVPLTATVMHSNGSNMLSRLLKLGFMEGYSLTDRDFRRWQPRPTDIQDKDLS